MSVEMGVIIGSAICIALAVLIIYMFIKVIRSMK